MTAPGAGTPGVPASDVPPLPPLRSIGALAAWRRELTAGRRGDPASPSTWVLDDLWRAACWEQSPWNAEALDMRESARHDMDRAAELLGVKPVAPAQSAPASAAGRMPPRQWGPAAPRSPARRIGWGWSPA